MLKKLKLKMYNKKTKEKLQGVIFDDFGYYLDIPFPMFKTLNAEGKIALFAPKTIEMLELCVTNLNLTFFTQVDRDEFEIRLRAFCYYLGLNINKFDDLVLTYETKKVLAENPRITTEHLK